MNNVFLPTISDILASEGLETFISSHQRTEADPIDPRYLGDQRQKRLKAEREWFSAVGAVNQLLKTLVIHNSRESSGVGNSHKYRCSNSVSHRDEDHLTPDKLPPPIVTLPTLTTGSHLQGLVISGMSPILTHSALALNFATQIFIPQPPTSWDRFSPNLKQKLPLLPTSDGRCASVPPTLAFPLLPQDPLVKEPFCVVLTPQFSLAMVLGTDLPGDPAFLFSFDPDRVEQVLKLLRQRMSEVSSHTGIDLPHHLRSQLDVLDELTQQFYPVTPHYQTVTQFSRLLLQNLPPQEEKKPQFQQAGDSTSAQKVKSPQFHYKSSQNKDESTPTSTDTVQQPFRLNQTLYSFQVELLQAIAHEVRTPLATIHTLTRLLLKRRNLDPEVVRKRLEMIDHECTTQIDRFNLIFRAVELELSKAKKASQGSAAKPTVQLTPMSLGDIFQNSLPRWQKQARQRNHTLEVNIPQKLPTVVSDPTMLDQVLTGVIENFTRSLPAGSHIMVDVRLAGHLLKLQLESQSDAQKPSPFGATPKSPLKSLGPLLMFQPETGVLSLNMTVTKNLFQALGGKLVVRQRPQQGKVMTIFLPLKS